MIKKTDGLMDIIERFPEVAPVLSSAGLHCIGCHISAFETLEQGCAGHGMTNEDVEELVRQANEKIEEYNKAPKVVFTQKAVAELEKRLGKPKKKFVRIVQTFGEFDFEAVNKKDPDEVIVEAKDGKTVLKVLVQPKIERMLRNIEINYDHAKKDFDAQRVKH